MTKPDIPVVTRSDLGRFPEHVLLQLWAVLYQASHPKENPRVVIHQKTGISEQALKNIFAGRGYIGGLAWSILEREIDFPLYTIWLDANKPEDKQ